MKTLKLFNAVVSHKSNAVDPFISEEGYIIEADAMWAKDRIVKYYNEEKLSGNDLNKTFHKSWAKIKNSSRFELYLHQILHYLSTYGSNFQDEIYIPNEILNVPETKLVYKVIKALSVEEMAEKCLSLLKSGIALKEETIDELISILVDELNYSFTGKEGIKNKEAIVKIADMYNVYPDNPVEFLRYIIYKTTNTTLLIKNKKLIALIKNGSYNPTLAFKNYNLEKLAEIFNRFKPLFLAYKQICPKTINRISKLSKKYHKPLVTNPLNTVTQSLLFEKDIAWLDNASPFALFKAISACYERVRYRTAFTYRIRNGKSWTTGTMKHMNKVNKDNYEFLLNYLRNRFNLSNKKIYLPQDIKYGLPTSEKMYVGNVPTGTRFYGSKLAVGFYWKNSWGAHDIDLSGMSMTSKIGWNARYNLRAGELLYSGDITNAPNGAVEYLYVNKTLSEPIMVKNNIYSGDSQCKYKIIIGKGDKVSKDYMMNPNNLFANIACQSIQKENILGILIPKKNEQCFVLLNFGSNNVRVSSNKYSKQSIDALYEQWEKPLSFNKIVKALGAQVVDTPELADFDYSLNNLSKDSFTKIFE